MVITSNSVRTKPRKANPRSVRLLGRQGGNLLKVVPGYQQIFNFPLSVKI